MVETRWDVVQGVVAFPERRNIVGASFWESASATLSGRNL
jgi:hypothetical protein